MPIIGSIGAGSAGGFGQRKTIAPKFTVATGGTISTCGDYKIHTFTGPGTLCVSSVGNAPANPLGGPNTVDYLVIAGGGAGIPFNGGGAGGYRFSDGTASGCYSAGPAPLGASALSVTVQGYPITVGAGGSAPSPRTDTTPNPGSNSIFSTITSAGGGSNSTGGSGAGASVGGPNPGFAGNTPPVSPPQGNSGGTSTNFQPGLYGGGAGGAGAVGGNGGPGGAGSGGAGLASSITASSVTRGGGGGGAGWQNRPGAPGGSGGGGNGAPSPSINGTANTGGGGGGGGSTGCSAGCARQSGAGGSGIVVIRYKFQ